MHCEQLARTLSAAADGGAVDVRASRHVASCIRCQAELAQYRRLRRALRSLRGDVRPSPPRLVADVVAAVSGAADQAPPRSLGTGRRPLGLGGLAVATAAAAGAGVVLVRRQRGHRATG